MPDDLPPPPPPPAFSPPSHAIVAGPTSATGGLRRASTILYWVTSAAMGLFVLALVNRKRTWSDLESGGDVSFRDLDTADGFVGGAVLVTFAVVLATTIVVSIWSLRVARNAKVAGAVDVSPGLACGGWYIPVAYTIVPFLQLRRVAEHGRRPTRFVSGWMALAIVNMVLWGIFRFAVGDDTLDVGEDVSAVLTREVVFGVLLLVSTVATAIVAMRAMREVEGV